MHERMRTGPDEGHIADEDVHELRELVQAALAEEAPQPRHARVVISGLHDRMAVLGDGHGPELPDSELACAETAALLPEYRSTRTVEPHRERDEKQKRQEHNQSHRRRTNIK